MVSAAGAGTASELRPGSDLQVLCASCDGGSAAADPAPVFSSLMLLWSDGVEGFEDDAGAEGADGGTSSENMDMSWSSSSRSNSWSRLLRAPSSLR